MKKDESKNWESYIISHDTPESNEAKKSSDMGKEQNIVFDEPEALQNITDALVHLADQSNLEDDENIEFEIFGYSGNFVKSLAKPYLYLIWYCSIIFCQSMVTNGFINSSLASLEKRYKLSSLQLSLIPSSFDIGCILVVIPVSYFGNDHRMVRWIGVGSIIMGIGCFIFISPYIFSGNYEYGIHETDEIPLCPFPDDSEKCERSKLSNFRFLFYLGHFVIGVGSSPLYTLGIAYIEKAVDMQKSALYIGISAAITGIGPAFGFVLCGLFLRIYVDIHVPNKEMVPENINIWVGAWWIGFLIVGILFIIFAIPLILFPIPKINFKSSEEKQLTKLLCNKLKDIMSICRSIMFNMTYICLTLAGSLSLLVLSGISTYGPKYLENMFELTITYSTMTAGIVCVPSLTTGALIGGVILSYKGWKLNGNLLFMFFTTLVSIPLLLKFFLKCQITKMAGLDAYLLHEDKINAHMKGACNEKCNCLLNFQNYRPGCGIDGMIYFSPCVAGCKQKSFEDHIHVFRNCSCIPPPPKDAKSDIQLFGKTCHSKLCYTFYVFLVLLGIFLFITFLRQAPLITATMVSVKSREISVALGIQSILNRCFGSIPGPILFGYCIDLACIYWQEKCGISGNCVKYNDKKYSLSFFSLGVIIVTLNATCFIVAWIFHVRKGSK